MVTWAASPYCWVLNVQPHVDRDISASMGAEAGKGSGVGAKPLPYDSMKTLTAKRSIKM